MPNPVPWSDSEIRRLLAVGGSSKALAVAFPGIPIGTLKYNLHKYRHGRPDLMPGSKAQAIEPIEIGRIEVPSVPRSEYDKLARQLDQVKRKRQDYLDVVWQATTDAIGLIRIPPVVKPHKDSRRNDEEVALALLSDLQTAKITPDYNTEVCRERVMRYARKIVALANVQRKDHPVRKCVVAMLGDMLEGVDIFPGQQWLIDSTLYRQVFETTPTILVDFLRYLLANFDEVEVWAVQGNHGRIGRRGMFGPEDNADRMVYKLVQMLMRDEPRLNFVMSDPAGERAWYMVGNIGNYSAMLIHGDQVKPTLGMPFYGIGKKVGGWASGGIPEPFKDVLMGHWHQRAAIPLNKRTAYVNGSTESTNTYAAEFLAAQSDPSQWLLFVHPENGHVTAQYPVYLD